MPDSTPRERLTSRVATNFELEGFDVVTAQVMAVEAVDAFNAREIDHRHYGVVAAECGEMLMALVPSFTASIRSAIETAATAFTQFRAAAQMVQPWAELAQSFAVAREQDEPAEVEYDASGLPRNEAPSPLDEVARERSGEPCIESGCGGVAVNGTAFCAECMPQPREGAVRSLSQMISDMVERAAEEHGFTVPDLSSTASEVAQEDTGRPATHFRPYRRPEGIPADAPAPMFEATATAVNISTDGGQSWVQLTDAVQSVEIPTEDEPPAVAEFNTRQYHLSVARRLRQLGCTYRQLRDQHAAGDFDSGEHSSFWFTIAGSIDLEQMDRAEFVLRGLELEDGQPALVVLSDAEIAELEEGYPTDRITGAPHHYIVNGDHSACGCGGHQATCDTHDDPVWKHAPSICGIPRTLCTHWPVHHYSQRCEYYAGLERPPVVGHTAEGEEVRGPVSG